MTMFHPDPGLTAFAMWEKFYRSSVEGTRVVGAFWLKTAFVQYDLTRGMWGMQALSNEQRRDLMLQMRRDWAGHARPGVDLNTVISDEVIEDVLAYFNRQ
jgi:hypothetical protein